MDPMCSVQADLGPDQISPGHAQMDPMYGHVNQGQGHIDTGNLQGQIDVGD